MDPNPRASWKEPSFKAETMPQLSCPLWERFSSPDLTSAKPLPLPINPKIPLIIPPKLSQHPACSTGMVQRGTDH